MKTAAQCDERHCLFRNGGTGFAVPARQVREVSFPPPLVPIPGAPPLLAGICHFRNEFLPVLQWPVLTNKKGPTAAPTQLLIFEGREGSWALQVDRVTGLEDIEITPATETGYSPGEEEMVVGWGTFRHHSVRVIDSELLYQTARRLLREVWRPETMTASMSSCC